MSDVFQYEGQNPPGLDVLSKHRTVVWKHPQHGWLRAEKNGSFTPLDAATAQRLLGTAPPPPSQPTTTTTTTRPAAPAATAEPAPTVGAGTTKMNLTGTMDAVERSEEAKRARAEASHQATLDKARFTPESGPDPMAGLGLTERAKVQELVRGGMKVEEAVKKVRKPTASEQAQALVKE